MYKWVYLLYIVVQALENCISDKMVSSLLNFCNSEFRNCGRQP